MLTRRQKDLLDYLQSRPDTAEAPSFEEMREALGLRSKSGVHRLVVALEQRGHIRRLAGRARAIEVIRRRGGVPPKAANPEIAASLDRLASNPVPDMDAFRDVAEALREACTRHGIPFSYDFPSDARGRLPNGVGEPVVAR